MNDSTLPPTTKPRRAKGAIVRKGFGLHDWMRLKSTAKDLAQRQGRPLQPITIEEVNEHSSVHNGWVVLHGKVYNITPYLHYHPGGLDILKPSLGKDCTALFEKYHRWVNVEGLIGTLLLGSLEVEKDDNDGFQMPAPRPPSVR